MIYNVDTDTDLCGADETRSDHFRYDIHKVFRLLYDVVDFREGGGFSDRRILDGELKLLNVSRYPIKVLQ